MTNDTATIADSLAAEAGTDDRQLVIKDLHVVPAANRDIEILRGIDLEIRKGEVHAIMGRNLSLIHISEPTRLESKSRMPASA